MLEDSQLESKPNQDDIAIVGMACRFPGGANSISRFWSNLINGVDAVCEVPKDRWDLRKYYSPNGNKVGKSSIKYGGFLQEDIYAFDPGFFGISPRDSEPMDPQQRLLLETCWEAFEDAGLPQEQIDGSDIGVFIGGFMMENTLIQLGLNAREHIDKTTATAFTATMLSNRLSYAFNLKGPSITTDTACSSSLVSTHLACQAMWNGDCSAAVVGGVNAMLHPDYFTAMNKGGFLSPNGRCFTYSEDASGYTRAEGAGIAILKPLSRAINDNDNIYAVITSSGSNQDGKTTQGIAYPSGEAQEALLRKTVMKAGIQTKDLHYIEAHGTGTQAGDKTETTALHNALAKGGTTDKVFVGSVKSQIGHMEAGAGIASLIKTALTLKNKTIAPNLHFDRPNPNICFQELLVKVPTKVAQLPSKGIDSYAAINSFGYGGTNASIILKTAPVKETQVTCQRNMPTIIPFSAKSDQALTDLAKRYISLLEHQKDIALADLAYSTQMRRSHFEYRLAIPTDSISNLKHRLEVFVNGEPSKYVHNHRALPSITSKKLAFVYTGMGPQWFAMGRELYETSIVYKASVDNCDTVFRRVAGWSILDEMMIDESNSRMDQTQVAQPANFVLQVGLTAVLKSFGITPSAVVGHSVGEVSAAYISGALSLEEAILVSHHRSRLQAACTGGAMLAVGLSEKQYISQFGLIDNVSIAAVNSPESITLSGDKQALRSIAKQLEVDKLFNRFLRVEVAYHSFHMESIKEDILAVLSSINPKKENIPFYSTVTGSYLSGDELGASYWWKNVRQSVRFADCMFSLLEDEYSVFLEVGPHPVLSSSIQQIVALQAKASFALATLRRTEPEAESIPEIVANLYTHGISPDWSKLHDARASFVALPHYPWQHGHYRRLPERNKQDLYGQQDSVFFNEEALAADNIWQVDFNDQFFPWVPDHKVHGSIVFPGAGYIAAAVSLQSKIFGHHSCQIENIHFHAFLGMSESKAQFLQTKFTEETQTFTIYSTAFDDTADKEWTKHASGRICSKALHLSKAVFDVQSLKLGVKQSVPDFYEKLRIVGLDYGPSFNVIKELYTTDDGVGAKLESQKNSAQESFLLNPTLLDGAFQTLISTIIDRPGASPYVPVSIGRILMYQPLQNKCWCRAYILESNEKNIKVQIDLYDDKGAPLVQLQDVMCQVFPIAGRAQELQDILYQIQWEPVDDLGFMASNTAPKCFIFTHDERDALVQEVCEKSISSNIPCTLIVNNKVAKNILYPNHVIELNHDTDLAGLLKQESPTHLVDVRPYTNPLKQDEICIDSVVEHLFPLISLVQMFDKSERSAIKCLDVITRRSCGVVNSDPLDSYPSACISDMLKVFDIELKDQFFCRSWDVDNSEKSIKYLAENIYKSSKDRIIALRSGNRYSPRFSTHNPTLGNIQSASTATTPITVELAPDGKAMDRLSLRKAKSIMPNENQVEIHVHYSGVNHKDILKIYNRLDSAELDKAYSGNALGMEISGIITKLGANVEEFSVGDEVIAVAPNAFCSFVTLDTVRVVKKAKSMTMAEAANIIPLMIAYHGLINIARIEQGERVLIHDAVSPLGQAAIQLATYKKADIFVTADTVEHRKFLQNQGLNCVYDSQSLNFPSEILADTNGIKIDVVINSTAGDSLLASFELLAPYGRFVEISKKDIEKNALLPMRAFSRNTTFSCLDIDQFLLDRPAFSKSIMKEVVDCYDKGIFRAVPIKEIGIDKYKEAFTYDNQHMGKTVISVLNKQAEIYASPSPINIDSGGSYLITGGTKGFGLAFALWLVEKGAGHVVLASRSGKVGSTETAALNTLVKLGGKFTEFALDVCNFDEVADIVKSLNQSDKPLKGILHAATSFEEDYVDDISQVAFQRAISPKVAGSLNLYRASASTEIDFFLSFSSIASVIGNQKQISYVAANSFLDALAKHAQAQGYPMISINWGAVSDTGYVQRNNLAQYFDTFGIGAVSSQQCLAAFDHALVHNSKGLVVTGINWDLFSQLNKNSITHTSFKKFYDDLILDEDQNMELADMDAIDLNLHVSKGLKGIFGKKLKLPQQKVDLHTPINLLGVDSLSTIELSVEIEKYFQSVVSSVDLLSGPTLNDLVEKITHDIDTAQRAPV